MRRFSTWHFFLIIFNPYFSACFNTSFSFSIASSLSFAGIIKSSIYGSAVLFIVISLNILLLSRETTDELHNRMVLSETATAHYVWRKRYICGYLFL